MNIYKIARPFTANDILNQDPCQSGWLGLCNCLHSLGYHIACNQITTDILMELLHHKDWRESWTGWLRDKGFIMAIPKVMAIEDIVRVIDWSYCYRVGSEGLIHVALPDYPNSTNVWTIVALDVPVPTSPPHHSAPIDDNNTILRHKFTGAVLFTQLKFIKRIQ